VFGTPNYKFTNTKKRIVFREIKEKRSRQKSQSEITSDAGERFSELTEDIINSGERHPNN
jgi:hypothetical protein